MKIDFKDIINIKNINELKKFDLDKPLYFNNYLFHYLIIFNKYDIIKLSKFPIYKENDEDLNGIFLASKYDNIEILKYLIKTYPEYVYNKNSKTEQFINYMNPESIIKILDLKLEWEKLFLQKVSDDEKIIDLLLSNCDYDDLLKILKVYKPTDYPLNALIVNENISTENLIDILKLFDSNIYNLRDNEDLNLIFSIISRNNTKLLSFILENNVESNYYTMVNTITPLMFSYFNNNLRITKQLWEHIKKDFDYTSLNRFIENIAHFLLNNSYHDPLSLEILSNCPSYTWHQHNINKATPLHLITKLNFENFHNILINKEINLEILVPNSKDNNKYITLKNLLINNNNENSSKWLNFLSKQPIYKEDNDIIVETYPYIHGNLFQSTFKDVSMIIINIKDKYKNLYLPYIDDYSLKNLNTLNNITLNWVDSILEIAPIFPWIICYDNEDKYWIHNYLNNLINSTRREKKYDFAIVYLSLVVNNTGLHANILIYDFNRMTIERFDPYGDTVYFDKKLDEVLDEELCWNTGLTYLKPSDYMPVAGFQTISDELNPLNQKSGDFGGFCLAWCTWFLEHRIINQKVNQKDLVKKLIKKISMMNITFMEYIRNYANKLNEQRVNTLLKIGINDKKISNTVIDGKTNNLLNKYLVTHFSTCK
jgi:hypothetical protein